MKVEACEHFNCVDVFGDAEYNSNLFPKESEEYGTDFLVSVKLDDEVNDMNVTLFKEDTSDLITTSFKGRKIIPSEKAKDKLIKLEEVRRLLIKELGKRASYTGKRESIQFYCLTVSFVTISKSEMNVELRAKYGKNELLNSYKYYSLDDSFSPSSYYNFINYISNECTRCLRSIYSLDLNL